ncbi:response regulator [Verrucomicrobiales bacterium BCK34]|nr:response regulator [Verrucomicrobiales bacterium BCK34]
MQSKIHIIDDNEALTALLAKTLSKFGFQPVVENNPLLALNSVRHHMPDLILLDIMMPERDGGRVLADLRADLSLRYIPVVLLTAIAREAQGLASTGGITSTVVAKPVQLKELLHLIQHEIESNQTYQQQQRPSQPSISGETPLSFSEDFAAAVPGSRAQLPPGDESNTAAGNRDGSSFSPASPNTDFSRETPQPVNPSTSAFGFPPRDEDADPPEKAW